MKTTAMISSNSISHHYWLVNKSGNLVRDLSNAPYLKMDCNFCLPPPWTMYNCKIKCNQFNGLFWRDLITELISPYRISISWLRSISAPRFCVILPRSELSTVLCTVKLVGVPSTVGTEYLEWNGHRKFCRLMWLSMWTNFITRFSTKHSKQTHTFFVEKK